MKNTIKMLQEQIESLKGDAYFYDMQIKFITYLKENSPEVENEMDGDTFEDLINQDKILKEKILQNIIALNVQLKNLTNEKAS